MAFHQSASAGVSSMLIAEHTSSHTCGMSCFEEILRLFEEGVEECSQSEEPWLEQWGDSEWLCSHLEVVCKWESVHRGGVEKPMFENRLRRIEGRISSLLLCTL